MSFSDDVKLKAQSALEPFLVGDYPSPVKNPILLLNYLYQHAVIPSPRYCVIPTRNHSSHAVSCKIGDLQTTGFGNTNKVAKTNAAQQFLDMLFKPINVSHVPSSLFDANSTNYDTSNVYALVSSKELNSDGVLISQNRSSFSSAGGEMEVSVSNTVNESTFPIRIVEPQMAQDEVVHAGSGCEVCSDNMVTEPSDSNTMGDISVNMFENSPLLATHQSNCNSNISEEEFQKNPLPIAREPPSCDDFFDPFFKQRPPSLNSGLIVDTKSAESCNHNQENEINHNDDLSHAVENKNVFALLQKKTQKHLKLIPRFRIENTESGFRCGVQLGSFYASGEGRNKKVAKTKAAVSLLNQIKDLN